MQPLAAGRWQVEDDLVQSAAAGSLGPGWGSRWRQGQAPLPGAFRSAEQRHRAVFCSQWFREPLFLFFLYSLCTAPALRVCSAVCAYASVISTRRSVHSVRHVRYVSADTAVSRGIAVMVSRTARPAACSRCLARSGSMNSFVRRLAKMMAVL